MPVPWHDDKRVIAGGPLLDLRAVQSCLESGEIDANCIWVATEKADDDLYTLSWSYEDVCTFIAALRPDDYRKSEWARSSVNSTHACDVYVMCFDDTAWERDRNAPEYYLKFSINPVGHLTICVMSCHLS